MNLNVNNILVIGLGIIGSSIALSAKSKGINVHGFDSDSSITEHAIKSDVIDQSVSALESINSKEYAKPTFDSI